MPRPHPTAPPDTTTPIKHLVVVFQENASFDHYFGTYPQAANPPGDPPFTARPDTPTVNNLLPSPLNGNRDLRVTNPNAAKPFRLDRSQFITCSQSHGVPSPRSAPPTWAAWTGSSRRPTTPGAPFPVRSLRRRSWATSTATP